VGIRGHGSTSNHEQPGKQDILWALEDWRAVIGGRHRTALYVPPPHSTGLVERSTRKRGLEKELSPLHNLSSRLTTPSQQRALSIPLNSMLSQYFGDAAVIAFCKHFRS